jgi:hypothetical protein
MFEAKMSTLRYCDICDRSEFELPEPTKQDTPKLQMDEDGLWVCHECSGRLTTTALDEPTAGELPDKLRSLVGTSAGEICTGLNLPYEPPYQSVIDAASKIAYDEDRYMSAWSFVTQWPDGTTLWQDQEGDATAVVSPDGSVDVESW